MNIFWLYIGLSAVGVTSILAIFLSLRAAARLGQLLSAVRSLDWDSVADLATDVQKLKKQVQRYRNDENAQMKTLQKQALHHVADQVVSDMQPNVTNIHKGG